MGALSLKLPNDLLEASGDCARALRLSRAAYIRCAIERMNRDTWTQLRAWRLADVSVKVREESMLVNAEFAAIERDPRGAGARRGPIVTTRAIRRVRFLERRVPRGRR